MPSLLPMPSQSFGRQAGYEYLPTLKLPPALKLQWTGRQAGDNNLKPI